MNKYLPVAWDMDVPVGMIHFAKRRTQPLLAHFGRNIASMPIEQLVTSCYMQGVRDAFQFHDGHTEPMDYQI